MDKSKQDQSKKTYDVVVVGGGPAGLTAALTAARARLSVIVLAKRPGGYVSETFSIENYPGFTEISGPDLAKKMIDQVVSNGVEIVESEVKSIARLKKGFKIKNCKDDFRGKTVIITTGSDRRTLGIPGESRLEGKGVSYCATADGPSCKGKIVGIVGGSDSAGAAAIYLSEFAKKVYVFFRGEKLSSEPKRREYIRDCDTINLVPNTNITRVKGRAGVDSVICDDGREVRLDILFVVVGSTPAVKLAKLQKLNCDAGGFIKVDSKQRTSVEGIFAAGDITTNSDYYRQIITACAEGAIAANSAFRYLR